MGEKAAKSKRPASYDLNAATRRRDLLVRIGLTSIVVIFAVVLVGYIVVSTIIQMITMVVGATGTAVIYYELRTGKERQDDCARSSQECDPLRVPG